MHISSYVKNAKVLYTYISIDNTGGQRVNGKLIVAAASLQNVIDEASTSNRRVTSLDVVNGVSATYSAVLVEKETSNERCQLIGHCPASLLYQALPTTFALQ
jgi:hypothetical protein